MRTYEMDGYQISVQNLIAFIYTNNQLENIMDMSITSQS